MVEKQQNLAGEFQDFLKCRKEAMADDSKAVAKSDDVVVESTDELCGVCNVVLDDKFIECQICQAGLHRPCASRCVKKVHLLCSAECKTVCCVDEVEKVEESAADADEVPDSQAE